MKMKMISLSIVTASLIFSGCNDSDSDKETNNTNNTNNTEQSSIQKVYGAATDGYVRNALVCLDINRDNECNDNEPYTKSNSTGNYDLNIDSVTDLEKETAQILVYGGIDNASEKAFTGLMKSPLIPGVSEININPLTTLATGIVNNSEAITKIQTIADTLGITAEELRSDPLKLENQKVYEIAVKVQKSMEILSESMEVTGSVKEKSELVNLLVEKFNEQFNGVEMNDFETLISKVDLSGNDLMDKANQTKDTVIEISSKISLVDLGDIEKIGMLADELKENAVNEIDRIKSLNDGDFIIGSGDTFTINTTSLTDNFSFDEERIIKILNMIDFLENPETMDIIVQTLKANPIYVNNLTLEQLIIEISKEDLNIDLKDKIINSIKKSIIFKNALDSEIDFSIVDQDMFWIDDSSDGEIGKINFDSVTNKANEDYMELNDNGELIMSSVNQDNEYENYKLKDSQWVLEDEGITNEGFTINEDYSINFQDSIGKLMFIDNINEEREILVDFMDYESDMKFNFPVTLPVDSKIFVIEIEEKAQKEIKLDYQDQIEIYNSEEQTSRTVNTIQEYFDVHSSTIPESSNIYSSIIYPNEDNYNKEEYNPNQVIKLEGNITDGNGAIVKGLISYNSETGEETFIKDIDKSIVGYWNIESIAGVDSLVIDSYMIGSSYKENEEKIINVQEIVTIKDNEIWKGSITEKEKSFHQEFLYNEIAATEIAKQKMMFQSEMMIK